MAWSERQTLLRRERRRKRRQELLGTFELDGIRQDELVRARKSKYKLTPEKFEALLVKQDRRCAICREPLVKPCVDHDHSCCPGDRSCGKCVRGLLCRLCNSGIGHLQDSVLLLESALRYLRGSNDTGPTG